MSITVYWACLENEWMRAKEPENVLKKFYSLGIHDSNSNKTSLNYCPAFNKNLKNVYSINSIYDYSFFIENNQVHSKLYDQVFFNDHILIRSIEKKFFSFNNRFIFFTEEDSLLVNTYQFPFLEQNEISKRCIPIPGEYDIGKWFRNLEFPFILKDEFTEFSVSFDDIMYYIKFNTDEKIILKQFYFSDKLQKMLDDSLLTSAYKIKRFKSLEEYYSKSKIKPLILKEIKDNLLF